MANLFATDAIPGIPALRREHLMRSPQTGDQRRSIAMIGVRRGE
jgi:hypothetical protein